MDQLIQRLQEINGLIFTTQGRINDWNQYEQAVSNARRPYVDRMRRRIAEPSSPLFGTIRNPEQFIANYESQLPDYTAPRPEQFNIYPFTGTKVEYENQLNQLLQERDQLNPLLDTLIQQTRQAEAQQLQALMQQAPMEFDEEPRTP